MPNVRGTRRSIIASGGIDLNAYLTYLKALGTDGPALYYDFQDAGSVALATNQAVALGRDIALKTYADYTAGLGWSNPSGQLALHTAGNTATLQLDGVLAIGKEYQIKTTVSGRTAGSVTLTDGVAISANGEDIQSITSTGTDLTYTPTSDFDGTLDVSLTVIQQENIAASSSFGDPANNPLNADIVGATVEQDADGLNVRYAYSFDGVNDYVDIYSAEVNSIFNPSEGTLIVPCRVDNADVWTDGVARNLLRLDVDSNNLIDMRKDSLNNVLRVFFYRNGDNINIQKTAITTTDWFLASLVWDTTDVYFYLDSTLVGSLGNTGTWVGNLNVTKTVIGALSTSPTQVWHGLIGPPVLTDYAMTATEIETYYQRALKTLV